MLNNTFRDLVCVTGRIDLKGLSIKRMYSRCVYRGLGLLRLIGEGPQSVRQVWQAHESLATNKLI